MRIPFCLALAVTLAACGGSDGGDYAAPESGGRELDCSAVKPMSAPEGQPNDDILGMRAGMSLTDVRLSLSCTNRSYRFEETRNGYSLPDMPDGSFAVTQLVAQLGEISGCNPADPKTLDICTSQTASFGRIDETVTVFLAGLPGQEKAFAFAREVNYPEGKEAAITSIGENLTSKYGKEPNAVPTYGGDAWLSWTFDSAGRRMSAANPELEGCIRAVGVGNGSPRQLRPGCRLTINARIDAEGQLSDRFSVVVVDQQAALDAIDAAKAAIQAARLRAEQTEVERAKQRSGNTQL